MRRVVLVALAVSAGLSPLLSDVAIAKPATTPSAENARTIAWAYEQAAAKYAEQTRIFVDVDLRDHAYGSVSVLKAAGIVKGFADGTVKTWAAMSRGEAAVLAARALYTDDVRSVVVPVRELLHDELAGGSEELVRAVTYALGKDLLLPTNEGALRLDAPATVNDVRRLVGLGALPGGDHPATRGEGFTLLVDQMPSATLTPSFVTGAMPKIEIRHRDVLADGVPVRGLMINWMVREYFEGTPDRAMIGRELDRMKDMGFVGVSTEIGWDDMQPDEGTFTMPPFLDALFDEAAQRGLWVTLLLSPHYTPRWVFQKHGDILLRDNADRPVVMGEYMTFSPSSPAAEDQIAWQKRAASSYAQRPNLLALFLSNEQSYGNKQDLDYSTWAAARWQQWRSLRGLEPAAMPRNHTESERLAWQRFRQDNLLEFLNRSAETVSAGLPRFVPVSHKVIFYEATSAYAPQYGLHPTPGRLHWDVVGADIYGLTPNVYPAQFAHDKPILVIETNLPGDWDAESMRKYLVYQSLQGIAVQTLFRWNPCEDENCLFHLDGRPWKKTGLIREAARTIAAIPEQFPVESPSVAILVPTNAVALSGDKYWEYQYRFDDIVSRYEADPGVVLELLWSDDLLPVRGQTSNLAPRDLLRGLQTIYVALPATDRDDSDGLVILVIEDKKL